MRRSDGHVTAFLTTHARLPALLSTLSTLSQTTTNAICTAKDILEVADDVSARFVWSPTVTPP